MCTYIFAVLPQETDAEALRPLAKQHEISLKKVEWGEFRSVAGSIFYTTWGFCDCGTVIGSAHYPVHGEPHEQIIARETEKLRRKGWSETKIARWRADKDKSVEKGIAARERELQRWLDFVPAALNSRTVPWLGVFYHSYNYEHARQIVRTERHSADHVTEQFLKQMQEDVLYRFTP